MKGDGKLHFEDIKLESYSAESASSLDVQKVDNKTKNIPEYKLNSNILEYLAYLAYKSDFLKMHICILFMFEILAPVFFFLNVNLHVNTKDKKYRQRWR